MEAEGAGFGWQAEAEFTNHASFDLNGLYHIWRPLKDMVQSFLIAAAQKKQGNPQPMRDWENDLYGQSWEDEAQKAAPEPLMERREPYKPSLIPWPILYLTAGVDVQDDRVEVEVIGWRALKRDEPEESWGIEDLVFYREKKGDKEPAGTRDMSQDFQDLDELLKREYTTQDGRVLRISATCIDSAGHRTDEVYRFCNRRISRHIYAIVGRDGPRPIWPRRAGKSRKYKNSLVWTVGVDTAKELIYSCIQVVAPGPGYMHFPETYPLEFFQGLCSEQVKIKYNKGRPYRFWWCPPGVRNEPLDRRNYALAALRSRSIPWEILAKSAPSEPPETLEPTSDGALPPPKAPPAAAPPPPPSPYGTGRFIRGRTSRR